MIEKTRIIGGIIDDRCIVTEPICNLSEIIADELSREMLLELKKNLSNIIFQKDYTYSRVTEYLAHMYESIDSSGYPLNAASDYVEVLPKIIAVADVYDAMTTDRVYKKGAKPIEAIEFLSNEGRKTLDNQVLMLFLRNIPLYDFKSVSMTKQGGQFNCKSIPF